MSEEISELTAETGNSVECQRSGPIHVDSTPSPSRSAHQQIPGTWDDSEWVMRKISTLDSEYVKKHLGTPLSLALSEILSRRPSDPIHYLGHWLLKWRWNQEHKQLEEDKINDLLADRRRFEEEIEEEKRFEAEKIENARRDLRMDAEVIARDMMNLMCNSLELPDLPEPPEPEVPELEPTLEEDEELEPTEDLPEIGEDGEPLLEEPIAEELAEKTEAPVDDLEQLEKGVNEQEPDNEQ